jgi:uncharacterized Ntn-hydrolase superfamily protein
MALLNIIGSARPTVNAGAIVVFAVLVAPPAGATYSIVAADATARQVGGAVTSCVAPQSVELVYRSAPGHGAIHAQAAANTSGRDRGVMLLEAGTAPADVIAQITTTSFDSRFQTRQYGVVDLSGRAAGFTGTSAQQYREDRQGSVGSYVYSIQGNILTGRAVLDQAETGFKTRGCDLAERLMLALAAGAENGGGDSRCTNAYGLPSDASSLEVDREGEPAGSYLRIAFTSTNQVHENPIVRLRASFDTWRTTHPCPTTVRDGGVDGSDASGGATGGGGAGGSGFGGAATGGAATGGAATGGVAAGGAPMGVAAAGGAATGGMSAGGAATGGTNGGGAGAAGVVGVSGGANAGASGTAGPASGSDGGCGCRIHRRNGQWSILVGAVAWIWLARRRIARRKGHVSELLRIPK